MLVFNGILRGNYFVLGSYYNYQGIIKELEFEWLIFCINISYDIILNKLWIGQNFMVINQCVNQVNDLVEGVMNFVIEQQLIVFVCIVDGFGWGGFIGGIIDCDNFFWLIEMNKDNVFSFNKLFGNVYFEWIFIVNLILKFNVGIEQNFFYNW